MVRIVISSLEFPFNEYVVFFPVSSESFWCDVYFDMKMATPFAFRLHLLESYLDG